MQPRKVKIKINVKALWGPFSQNKFGSPREVSPAPPPLGGPGSVGFTQAHTNWTLMYILHSYV